MPTYLDILNKLPGITTGNTTPSPQAGVGSDTAPAVIHSSTPAGAGNAVVERFRSVTAQMQSTANASIQQEIERIVNVPIMEDLTQEQIDLVSWWYCPNGTFKFFPEQAKAMVHYWLYGSLVCPISVGGGKCVLADTEIVDMYRGRKNVNDFGVFNIPSKNDIGKISIESAISAYSGVKKCVRLTLKSGQSVGLSTDHPVYTQRGWVKVENLNREDLIATPRIMPEPLQYLHLTDQEVRISAYLCSDGGTTGEMPSFTNQDNTIIDEFNTDLGAVGGDLSERKSKSKAREFYVRKITRYRGILFNQELSKNKRVPADFYLLPKHQVALFLNRFIACDGHINVKTGKIEIILASEGLIKDLQYMFLRLGVLTRKHFKISSYRKMSKRRSFQAWRLVVSGAPNILALFDSVGLIFGKESASKQLLQKTRIIKHNTNTDIVPIGVTEFGTICNELGYPKSGGDKRYRAGRPRTILRKLLGVTQGQYISRDKFKVLVKNTGYKGKFAWLADSDILWERIDSIVNIGESPVYDLSVPATHNFIGNGIFLHNTLISILVANDAYSRFGKNKILLMTPSHLVNQLRLIELPKYRQHMSINVPFFWIASESGAKRLATARSGLKGCYVVSYSLLSRQDGAELMNAIEPDLIIGDEIHRIASANPSARGRRFKEIVKRFHPDIVGLSGTITKKSPRDYHFLVTNALRERSFVPRQAMLADDWAMVIDSNAANLDQFGRDVAPQPGNLKPMVKWANKNFSLKLPNDLVGFRNAFSLRMQTTPGVITSTGTDLVGASLRISNLHISKAEKEATPGWGRLKELVKNLVELMVAPNGDEIEYPMHVWRYRYELEGIGGYNDLSWPTIEKIAERRKVTIAEADELLYRSQHHHKLHQEYARELRQWIKNRAKTGMDTPMLIGREMYVNGAKNVGVVLYEAWNKVREANFTGIIERDESFVRVCPFRINRIIKWAKEHHAETPNQGAVIWYDNIGVGIWLRDAFKEAGLPENYCPADSAGGKNIIDPSKRNSFTLATFNAYSEGLNIQHLHHTALYAQWPRSATIAEQSLGRLHRPGQPEDEVRVYGSFCSEFDNVLLAACLNDSAYVHQTIVGKQKLMYADWDERPKLMPYAVMKEWGCEPTEGTTESKKLLIEKFMEKDE